jgi:hypothetical protein
MLKLALGLIVLLVGSVAYAVIRKVRRGGPLIEQDGEPHSLRELVERRRHEAQQQSNAAEG